VSAGVELRITDTRGRRLICAIEMGQNLTELVDNAIIAQAEGRVMVLELEVWPGQAYEERGR
jgi:hypothetical protein